MIPIGCALASLCALASAALESVRKHCMFELISVCASRDDWKWALQPQMGLRVAERRQRCLPWAELSAHACTLTCTCRLAHQKLTPSPLPACLALLQWISLRAYAVRIQDLSSILGRISELVSLLAIEPLSH